MIITLCLGLVFIAAGIAGIRFATQVEAFVADFAPVLARSFTVFWSVAGGILFVIVGFGLLYVSIF